MEKNYIIKSVVVKAGTDGKAVGYNINYHHKNYSDSIQSQFYTVEDMKNLFQINNETQAMDLKGKEIAVKKELVIK